MKNLIARLTKNPKQMFFVDAIGALITTVSILGLLVAIQSYIGMPTNILYILGSVAIFFFIYSSSCFLFLKANWKPFLAFIIICNSIYGIISTVLLFQHSDVLTGLGYTYFILELIVIALVVSIEIKTYKTA